MFDQIQSVLLPFFLDGSERYEVRIAAFIVAMETKPVLSVLQMIAESLVRERNLEVGSYVYTYLRDISVATDPCLKTM